MRTIEEKFWRHVGKEAKNGCWYWIGYVEKNGYARFAFNYKKKGYKIGAHRASYIIHNNKLIDNLCVCHTCDHPMCVNPSHLFVATQYENMHDMIDKGRKKIGAQCSHSKFNAEQIILIRKQHQKGQSIRSLAREYGVYRSTISRIVNRRTYKEVA